jgi:tetratricopeptide (TPR) repeat protein
MARLDRLGTVKEVAQLGATLGREFTYELLKAVSPLDETTLQIGLPRLVEAELLYQMGTLPQTRYFFKHALIQDAAYQSLLRSKRQQYHQRIARVLEERFPETGETQPELLANHYTEAGLRGEAIAYWQRAGEKARQRSANVEAIGHLTKGLELLKTLPDTPERTQQELNLHTTLGPALVATKGYAAPEVEKAYTRARELCQQVGETPQLFPVLWGLWNFYLGRAECKTARELAEHLLTLAQSIRDLALILYAHDALGQTLYSMGEFVPARAHLEQGITLYDHQRHRSLAFLYGEEDSGVACQGFAAMILWFLGYPDQALGRVHAALTLAQELSNPHSLAFTLFFAAWLHQVRRAGQVAKEWAEAVITLSSEQGFALWLAGGTILQGWALAEQGQGTEGIARIRKGIAAWRATGQEWTRPYFLALLAETYGKVGQAEEGLTYWPRRCRRCPKRKSVGMRQNCIGSKGNSF